MNPESPVSGAVPTATSSQAPVAPVIGFTSQAVIQPAAATPSSPIAKVKLPKKKKAKATDVSISS